MKEKISLMIAPSYRCNTSCDYCYAKNYVNKFGEMDILTFVDLVDANRKIGNLQLGIMGGEPTIWKHINKALIYCKLRGVSTTVFTNGLETLKVMPSRIYFNISQYFEKEKQERVLKTLETYLKKKVRLVLRYNIEEKDNDEKIDEVIGLAKKYQTSIHLALVVPYKISKKLGNRMFKMSQKVVSAGIKCKSANPIPPCMFNRKQLEWMKQNTKYYSACELCKLPLVNPDGKTVQPCSKMFLFKEINDGVLSFEKIKKMYEKETEIIKNKLPMKKCYKCKYYLNKKCFGGCLAFRANALFGNK